MHLERSSEVAPKYQYTLTVEIGVAIPPGQLGRFRRLLSAAVPSASALGRARLVAGPAARGALRLQLSGSHSETVRAGQAVAELVDRLQRHQKVETAIASLFQQGRS